MAKDYLQNWAVLNSHIQELDEDTIAELIEEERQGRARPQFLIRLHGRYNKLRAIREKGEILGGKK